MKRLFVGLFVLVSFTASAQQHQSIDLLEYNLPQDSIRFYMLDENGDQVVILGVKSLLKAQEKQIAKSLIEQWERSPGHRENMLADHRYFGFGLSLRKLDDNPGMLDVYAVQTFGGRLEFK